MMSKNVLLEYKNKIRDTKDAEEVVKSEAVVKFCSAVVPAPFTLLQFNTNLNLPPPNWLSNSVSIYGVSNRIMTRSGFSSFSMANEFPDCISHVDVISDAENIKKLLKMSLSSSPISLLVHRVGNTLLIDDFDVKKGLLASGEGRWKLFRKLMEHALASVKISPNNVIEFSDISRSELKNKSLMSKFIYHSLSPTDAAEEVDTSERDPNVAIPLPYLNSEPTLPEPKKGAELPDPDSSHKFYRNVVWNFEDIQMLLGTDIPIFGGKTHPCISLRLRDANKPINVLTGLDYWLDNLMCNVPEVVMCYHLNGIVQRYELIKTEDLPNLPNSEFSPKVVRDMAQHILSFLKTRVTKAGHTYWLFKGRDSDVVKLYDLTSLCEDILDGGQTPFTVPVAMLMYRVARNMKHQGGYENSATIRTLLKNCLQLLQLRESFQDGVSKVAATDYPEIAASAHYMLADVYLPGDVDPESPVFPDAPDEETTGGRDRQENNSMLSSIRVASLVGHYEDDILDEPEISGADEDPPPPPPPLSSDVFHRCTESLRHLLNGFSLLSDINAAEPEMVNKSEAIPMPCGTPESTPPRASDATLEKSPFFVPVSSSPPKTNPHQSWSWSQHLRTLLLEKGAQIYITVFEKNFKSQQYGESLREAAMALRLLRALTPASSRECSLLAKVADALLILATRPPCEMKRHDEAYRHVPDMDHTLLTLLQREGVATNLPGPLPPALDTQEAILLASAACYSRTLELEVDPEQKIHLYRRVGNIENELGQFYMDKACALQQPEHHAKIEDLLSTSQTHLDAGLAAFILVKDPPNIALLHCNIGRLMRLRAHFYVQDTTDRADMASQERDYYNKALDCYRNALEAVKDRNGNLPIWKIIHYEMSTTLYSLATLLQDFPAGDKSPEDKERELTDILHRTLKYCDLDCPDSKLPVYQFRAAKVHQRLASLHHIQIRRLTNESENSKRKKQILQLCKLHYEKASRLLQLLESPTETFRVQMEWIALIETLAEEATTDNVKVKHMLNALELMVELIPTLKLLYESDKPCEVEIEEEKGVLGTATVLSLMIARLQHLLLTLFKLKNTKKDIKSKMSIDELKGVYGAALRCGQNQSEPGALARSIADVLQMLKPLLR